MDEVIKELGKSNIGKIEKNVFLSRYVLLYASLLTFLQDTFGFEP